MVNWAIVGLGDIVRKRVGAAIAQQPDSRIHACVTRDPERTKADLESLAPRRVFTDVESMVADPEVDAVYLATPVALHAAGAIAALRAGKDVIVEKPMAISAREAVAMRDAARQSGRRLAVAYYRRFWPRFQLIKDMLDEGRFGQIVLVRVALHSWFDRSPQAEGGWRIRPELSGGGVLSDVGSHRLDLLAWWFGLPKRLVARVETRTHDYAADDSAVMMMELSDGTPVTASFNWNSKTWTDEIHVVGTEAKVTLHPCDGDEAVVTVGREIDQRAIVKPENAHYPLIDDFARAIVEDRAPRFTADDGMQATQIIDAAHASSRRGEWVELGECHDATDR